MKTSRRPGPVYSPVLQRALRFRVPGHVTPRASSHIHTPPAWFAWCGGHHGKAQRQGFPVHTKPLSEYSECTVCNAVLSTKDLQ